MASVDKYISIDELSEYLKIKKRTLYFLVETMQIPHYRIGRLIRFKLSEIEEWMMTKKIGAEDSPFRS